MDYYASIAATNQWGPPSRPRPPPPAWQRAMAEAVRDPAELCRLLQLPPRVAAAAEQAAESLRLLAPRSYLARIRPGDPHDPLLRQILPQEEELAESPQFSADPLGEAASAVRPRPALEVPRQTLDPNNWDMRRPLPFLFSPLLSLHG